MDPEENMLEHLPALPPLPDAQLEADDEEECDGKYDGALVPCGGQQDEPEVQDGELKRRRKTRKTSVEMMGDEEKKPKTKKKQKNQRKAKLEKKAKVEVKPKVEKQKKKEKVGVTKKPAGKRCLGEADGAGAIVMAGYE